MTEHEELLKQLKDFARGASSTEALMTHIAQKLHETMARYNWVGFYLLDPAEPGVLIIGPFVGSFTPNPRIPFSQGLCGSAAATGRTVVVEDVTKDPRYLQGSSMVMSEVVVPIFKNGKFAAELDIESYFPGTFNRTEQEFAEACAAIVGEYLKKHP